MEGKRVITHLQLSRFLSFGPEAVDIELEPLNVLIGANGAGKSNFLEFLRLLHSLPTKLTNFVGPHSSLQDYFWRGDDNESFSFDLVTQSAEDFDPFESDLFPREHFLSVVSNDSSYFINDEEIHSLREGSATQVYSSRFGNRLVLQEVFVEKADGSIVSEEREITFDSRAVGLRESSLASDIHFVAKNELKATYLGIYHYAFGLGREIQAREPNPVEYNDEFLEANGTNLANVLQSLQHRTDVFSEIIENIRAILPRAKRIVTGLVGNRLQVFLEEEGTKRTIPASRLSDGTVRYLCLLTILLHPKPARIICLEDPEIGLHPDAIRRLGPLLKDAAKRTQLFVTTHSEVLISALSDVPEAVIVCEHDGKSSKLSRLDPERLKPWLENYSLGELWVSGEIGGNAA